MSFLRRGELEAVVVSEKSFPLEVPQKEASMKDEKKATKEEEMKDESEGFPSMDDWRRSFVLCYQGIIFG